MEIKEEIKEASPQEEAKEYPLQEKESETVPAQEREKEMEKAPSQTEEPVKKTEKPNKLRSFLLLSLSALLTALLLAGGFILLCRRPVTVEVGETPDYSHITKKSVVSFLCKIDTTPSEVDTSSLGESFVTMRFFGFVKIRSKVVIVDTIPPKVTPSDVCITPDALLKAEMFAKKTTDKTKVTFSFKGEKPDLSTPGKYTVTILATDEGKNKSDFKATLTVTEKRDDFYFEYGTQKEKIENHILSEFTEISSLDLSEVGGCGVFSVTGTNDDTFFLFDITILDTIPPKAEIKSFDILLGDTVTDEDMVVSITDFSSVTTEFLSRPDFSAPGEHKVDILLTDSEGNTAEFCSYVRIHDINKEVTAEAKCENSTLSDLIFKDDFSKESLSFPKEHMTLDMSLGENSATLSGKYNAIPITVNIEDTVPPEFATQTVYRLVGKSPSAADFVSYCNDSTAVTYSFEKIPSSNTEGAFDVVIIAKDLAGNTSKKSATVVFFVDREPPVISGHRNLSIIIGEVPAYLSGVSAHDAVWGNIRIKVDHSAADLKTAGTYKIIYSATDSSGNTATETVTLTVREPTRVCLNVANISQKPALPNGCEVVSLAIALKYAGLTVDPVFLYDTHMPKSPYKNGDPWTTYVGNAKGKGLGCYAPCVVETGNKYLSDVESDKRTYDVSGQSLSAYENYIDNGIPVIMWGTINMNGNSLVFWRHNVNGKDIVWHYYSHCLVMIGYTDYTYIFCDPLKGIVEYNKTDVEKSFSVNFRQACVVQ